ncbi:hypothetical protein F4819DRAFT_459088 [Hypoxylon fuscum]|nr:hypothetical protein F4819DRAFT_459088 [Hypoxylon fuscum]
MSSASFLFLSPTPPSELLNHILDHHGHTTTLIICASRADFLASLADGIHHLNDVPTKHEGASPDLQHGKREQEAKTHRLLSSPLCQVAASRHVRVVCIPTVTHLRAYLSVFSPDDSRVPAPPAHFKAPGNGRHRIILYGFLEMHRDTSEWSAQGLGNSASAVIELAHRLSWQAVVVEPNKHNSVSAFEDVLKEHVPFLSGGGRRPGPDSEEGAWTGRTVEVGRVMKRWFGFQRGPWDAALDEDGADPAHDEISYSG